MSQQRDGDSDEEKYCLPIWSGFYSVKQCYSFPCICMKWEDFPKKSPQKVGVGRVQIIWVDYSQIKTRLDIEPSRHLVSTITGNDIQYGGSRKRKKYKDKSFESLELAIVST